MAEMTTLTAAIYRKYETQVAPSFENATPGITARFELFYDERFPTIKVRDSVPARIFRTPAERAALLTSVPMSRSITALSSFRNWKFSKHWKRRCLAL
jgi:hypothetical protein